VKVTGIGAIKVPFLCIDIAQKLRLLSFRAQYLRFSLAYCAESVYNRKTEVRTMDLGKKLVEVREAANLSRSQLADLLCQKGIDVKTYTIGKWETGASKPTVETFLAICDICRVMDIRETFAGKRLMRLYDVPVSAGCGNYLDHGSHEMIEVDSTVPNTADYALRISGDSMMPRFVDQQIIFVHEQPSLDEGEIGVFCLNDEVYLKKLGRGCLISLNSRYEPIPIREYDDLSVFGKVVG